MSFTVEGLTFDYDPNLTSIENGVRFLDTNAPGWEDKIDLETFDILEPYQCIAGQVFKDKFSSGWLWFTDILMANREHIGTGGSASFAFAGVQHEREWREIITARRNRESADAH